MLIRFTLKLVVIFAFRPPIHVPNFSWIEACIQWFLQSVQIDEQEKMKKFLCWLISQKWLEGSYSNFEWGLLCMKANTTVNLILFGWDITEIRMCENRNFVLPVNILTLLAHTVFLGHTTHYHVSWCLTLWIIIRFIL